MQDIIIDSLGYMLISIVVSAFLAPVMINILYKFNQVAGHKKSKLGGGMEGDNSLYLKVMKAEVRNGTPNMGGILIWIIVPLLAKLILPQSNFLSVLTTAFIIWGAWGFLDVLVTNIIRSNPELRSMQERFTVRLGRFMVTFLLSYLLIWLIDNTTRFDLVDFIFWQVTLTTPVIILLSLIGMFAVYSAELTDGLDGLMIGIFAIIFAALAVLLILQGQYFFLPLIAVILGVVVVDLYFNIPPARFYNGGPGAMPLGIAAFLIALLTGNLVPYLIMSGLTWIVMLSSMIQIVAMRFFKKRVFKIAPLHHHFQAVGWPETKVVMRFWLITAVLCLLGIYTGMLAYSANLDRMLP